ncbi:MAG: hypothetical protein Q8M02_13130 [Candidatus Didemnitutus sp.]|nr:hypothetical protein [Candidatus Didemnitutus sp.]
MAAGDFDDLLLNLARLSGRPTATDLDDDLDLAMQVINEGLLECYAPIDGRRPPWAKRSFGVRFLAPVEVSIGVTQGSNVFTGTTPSVSTVGSVVRIGTTFYTYAGLNGANQEFVEPFNNATGTVGATFYHNSIPLDASVVEVMDAPELQGHGPLSPLSGQRDELLLRASFASDFGGVSWITGGASYETGRPLFYRADAGALLASAAYAVRFVVYPLPDRAAVVNLTTYVLPGRITSGSTLPRMPADKVLEILLPIIRFEWAITYKKYAGENTEGLRMKADKARTQLRLLCSPQTNTPTRIRPRFC